MKNNPVVTVITLIVLVFILLNWSNSVLFGGLLFLTVIGKCCNGYEDRNRRNKWWK